MPYFNLADVTRATALLHEKKLILYVEGTGTGPGASFYVVRSPNKIIPPAYYVYEIPGNIGGPGPTVEVDVKSATSFDTADRVLSLHTSTGVLTLRSLPVTDYAPDLIKFAPAKVAGVPGEFDAWSAVHNFFPPQPPRLRVTGEILVPSSGYTAKLKEHVPQGINRAILLLDLVLTEPPEASNPRFEYIQVEFEKQTSDRYTHVHILPHGPVIQVDRVD